MTKFKELKRIEIALEHENEAELQWALDYCTTRVKTAEIVYTMRKQAAFWRKMERKVRSALESSKCVTSISRSQLTVTPFQRWDEKAGLLSFAP